MSSRLRIIATPLSNLTVIEREPLRDARGFLERLYCAGELSGLPGPVAIAQINLTLTERSGTVRGMHYQISPHSEAKFVSCLRGRVFDVAVDLRRGSPTFLRWHGLELSSDNHRTLYIPPGFAHGLQTLQDDCEMLYLHTTPYNAQAERGLHPEDARIGIAWPAHIAELSSRDAKAAYLDAAFAGIDT